MYYFLNCRTCQEKFMPLLATQECELLYPDYDLVDEQAGRLNSERLQRFHESHYEHDLEELPEVVADSTNPNMHPQGAQILEPPPETGSTPKEKESL